MLKKFFDNKILMLVAVIATSVASQLGFADPALFFSLSPSSPDTARIGANNVGLRFIVDNPMGKEQTIEAIGVQAAGNLSYIGSVYITGDDFTLQPQRFTDQEPYYEVHWARPDGIFTLPPGKSELDFWFFVNKDTPVGAKFIFYIFEECFYTIADPDRIPILAIPQNPIQSPTILIEIGSLKVVAYQITPAYAVVGETCSPAGAELQNSEVEPVIVEDVVVEVDGDFAYGDLEQLAVGIGDSGVVRLGPVEPGTTYHFYGNWYFEKGQIRTLKVSIFVKSGAGHNFSTSVVDIIATGETYGFQVPVYGLPIGGGLIEIVVPEPITGFYGYVTDITSPVADLKATIIAINEKTREKVKTISENGYYEITGLEPGAYWLICYKQYYYASIRREVLLSGELMRVDFYLKPNN